MFITGGFWKGDILADIEDLEKMDVSEIYPRRINAKGVLTPQRREKIIFSVVDGTENFLKKIMESENPLKGRNDLWGVKISVEIFAWVMQKVKKARRR